MWHVCSRSGVTTLRTAIHLLLTDLLTSVELSRQHVATTVTLLLNLASVIVHSNNKLHAGRGTVVERRSLTGELSLYCARPAADG